jgi:DNA invertase Pin-like site-specific DNA recombinase
MSETTRSDRLLAAIRQSKTRKGLTADTSPELQRQHMDAWAKSKGHRIIGESLDLDVSGRKVAAWDRPDLGAWLRDRSDEFDGIIVDSLDRAGRDVEAFLNFQSRYLAPLGKSLHVVNPDIDLATPEGQMVAINLMAVAQFQADQLAAKMRDVNANVRGKGQTAGGPVPYGYVVVKLATPGYGYAIDPLDAWIVRKMADKYLAGNSMRSVAHWLNGCGIPSPRGARWGTETVEHILSSPTTAGIATKDYEPLLNASGGMVTLRDASGQPIKGIVSVAEWQAIRQLIKDNGRNGPRSNGSELLHVAKCGHCGQWLYSAPQTSRYGKTYRYLKCATKIKVEIPGECSNPVINAEHVERAIDRAIMSELGDVHMRVKHVTPANDKARELEFVETQLAGLAEALISGRMTPELAGRAESGLMTKRDRLIAEAHPEVVEWRDGDATFGEHWQALDWKGRQAFLVHYGVIVTVMLESKMTDLGTGEQFKPPAEIPMMDMPGSLSVGIGRHRAFLWLGDLETLRKSAAATQSQTDARRKH